MYIFILTELSSELYTWIDFVLCFLNLPDQLSVLNLLDTYK